MYCSFKTFISVSSYLHIQILKIEQLYYFNLFFAASLFQTRKKNIQ